MDARSPPCPPRRRPPAAPVGLSVVVPSSTSARRSRAARGGDHRGLRRPRAPYEVHLRRRRLDRRLGGAAGAAGAGETARSGSCACAATSASRPPCAPGFELSRGAVVATLDGDGQDDPAELPGAARQARRGLRPRVGLEASSASDAPAPAAGLGPLQPGDRAHQRRRAPRPQLRPQGLPRRPRPARWSSTGSCTATSR